MIIETSDNRFYRVEPIADPDMDHLWHGIELKRVRPYSKAGLGITWVEKTTRAGKKNWTYVRKVATRVVEA
jgi:hypothetical protein